MKVTFLGFIKGLYEYIGVARQGRGKGRIYFFRDGHVPGLQEDVDTLVVGSKIQLDEWFLEIPEKEFSKITEMLAPKSAKEYPPKISDEITEPLPPLLVARAKSDLVRLFKKTFADYPKIQRIEWSQMYYKGSSDMPWSFLRSGPEDMYVNGTRAEEQLDIDPEVIQQFSDNLNDETLEHVFGVGHTITVSARSVGIKECETHYSC